MWPHTEDKDLHPSTPELLGVLLHWILWYTICDEHQHAGKIFPGTSLFGQRILKEKFKGLSWEKGNGWMLWWHSDALLTKPPFLTAKFSISLQLHWILKRNTYNWYISYVGIEWSAVGVKQVTCHGVSALVRQRANGAEQSWAAQVGVQAELHTSVAAILDHAHSGFVLANLKSACCCRDETADVFEIGSTHAPRTVHQEQHIGHSTNRAFWEKYGGKRGREGSKNHD